MTSILNEEGPPPSRSSHQIAEERKALAHHFCQPMCCLASSHYRSQTGSFGSIGSITRLSVLGLPEISLARLANGTRDEAHPLVSYSCRAESEALLVSQPKTRGRASDRFFPLCEQCCYCAQLQDLYIHAHARAFGRARAVHREEFLTASPLLLCGHDQHYCCALLQSAHINARAPSLVRAKLSTE
mmetsp:Transcript_14875/g.40086  ORF Transcript_14875/g.40086 Transcript_14875/m.40086 type:complete len:186 (-) Transcript_14875:650-1207(-)